MAMIETAQPAPFGAITTYRVFVVPVSAAVSWVRDRIEAGRTLRALEQLSPAMRADIGLTEDRLADLRDRAAYF